MQAHTKARRISIFDTTLRDGEQAPGNTMSPQQKLELALKIEATGVDFIEIGFPASSQAEFDSTRLVAMHLTRAKFVSFCRATNSDVDVALEAGGTGNNHVLQILATGSDLHLEHKRRITRAAAISEMMDTVRYALARGVSLVSVGIEDASRADLDYLQDLVEGAVDAGAFNIVIADTTGYATPEKYGQLIAYVRSWVPSHIQISTHCHDDFGLSLANAIAGLQAGADEVQVTLGGIGERVGNTPLEEIGALLHYKQGELGLRSDLKLDKMYDAYNLLREIIVLEEPRNKAIFGKYAFGTAAGIHQQGLLRNPETYEYVEPSVFGRERSLLIARHSGRSVLRFILDQIGEKFSEEQLDSMYREYITERRDGDCEDLALLQERIKADLASSCSLAA